MASRRHSTGDRVPLGGGGLGGGDRDGAGLDDADRLALAAVPVEDLLDVHGVAVVALDGEHRVGDRRDLLLVEDARRGSRSANVDPLEHAEKSPVGGDEISAQSGLASRPANC